MTRADSLGTWPHVPKYSGEEGFTYGRVWRKSFNHPRDFQRAVVLVLPVTGKMKLKLSLNNIGKAKGAYSTCDLGNRHGGHQHRTTPSGKKLPWALPFRVPAVEALKQHPLQIPHAHCPSSAWSPLLPNSQVLRDCLHPLWISSEEAVLCSRFPFIRWGVSLN